MNPREIEVHIEELIMHLFAPGTRWDVAEALERELAGLLSERRIPDGWCASPERIDAGVRASGQSKPALAGGEVARAVYQGGVR